jgi:hypothetical protein
MGYYDQIKSLLATTRVWLTYEDIADNTEIHLDDVREVVGAMFVDREVAIQGNHVAKATSQVREWMYAN